MELNKKQLELCEDKDFDFTGLKALFINCTLKRSPETSNTHGLLEVSKKIMKKKGIMVEEIRAVDHDIATGVWPDMTKKGWEFRYFL